MTVPSISSSSANTSTRQGSRERAMVCRLTGALPTIPARSLSYNGSIHRADPADQTGNGSAIARTASSSA
jgi:hypothetical protein